MEPSGCILRRILSIGVMLFLLLALLAAAFPAAPSYAAAAGGSTSGGNEEEEEDDDDDGPPEKGRYYSDAQLAVVLALLEAEYGIEDDLVKQMKAEYEKNYAFDHKALGVFLDPAVNPFTASGRKSAGYRYSGSQKDVYSGIYINRRSDWHGDIKKMAGENAKEALFISKEVMDWIYAAHGSSRGADGYLQLVQSGTQETNYLNAELVQLRTDVLRQMDMQMRAAAEEMQDNADETSAFEQAVRTWSGSGSGSGY
ncbi:MAG: hypothetical protein LBU26_04190 [Synergistaceae bacterium]|jgi:hypothetical protein|nr:hypothetical protein [Synergistaceae bacterium]